MTSNPGHGESHAFHLVDGHVVVRLEGLDVLVDTGSPVSFGTPDGLEILGREYPLDDGFLGVTVESLVGEIGTSLDLVLGSDILGEIEFRLDPEGQIVTFFADDMPRLGLPVPVQSVIGVPLIRVKLAGQEHDMYLDTGAKLSYGPEDALAATPSERDAEDLYPFFGRFRTTVRLVETEVGGRTVPLEYGVLPEALQGMLLLGGADGILGTEILRHFAIGFALKENLVFLQSRDELRKSRRGQVQNVPSGGN